MNNSVYIKSQTHVLFQFKQKKNQFVGKIIRHSCICTCMRTHLSGITKLLMKKHLCTKWHKGLLACFLSIF